MNKKIEKQDTREKLLNLLNILINNTTNQKIIIPKNYDHIMRKLFKYIAPNANIISVSFGELEEIDSEKLYILGIDDLWIMIKTILKDWIFSVYSALNSITGSTEVVTDKLEYYLLYCFYIIKDVCRNPPKNVLKLESDLEIKEEILYVLLDYNIILNEADIFERVFDLIISYCETSKFSYKFYVVLKKFITKYFESLIEQQNEFWNWQSQSHSNPSSQLQINQNTQTSASASVQAVAKHQSSNILSKNMFKKFMDFTINALKINIKEVSKSNTPFTLFGLLFNQKKAILSKELDGSNIIEFFTILNICEEYSTNHVNNMIVFSVSFELFKFLFTYYNKLIMKNTSNDRIHSILKDMKSILHSYCIRIFDQCENYLQSNKNKTEYDKNTRYNMSLIEASCWEGLKIINLICKLETSLVSNINIKIKQVHERIALKQSGLVVLEILQFFIDNFTQIIEDVDYYIGLFFKNQLNSNYKQEILSFKTLEFLYINKDILEKKTQVFNANFPLILKIFATFPKYLDTKFFCLIDYMTTPSTINELFNYILDLPTIILIIENFEYYIPIINKNLKAKNPIELFKKEYENIVNFLLRDVALADITGVKYYDDKKLKSLFDSLIFTSRVHSTTKIVPNLMKKFFDVIILRDEIESAEEAILLIFDRFSHFHENENYKEKIKNLLIRKLEEIFTKWPIIVTRKYQNIIDEVKNNYSVSTKRELICLLCWSLGEFLDKKEDRNCFEDHGIREAYECLEGLLIENIKFFKSNNNDSSSMKVEESVDDIMRYYNTNFVDKTTDEEIINERILSIIITALGKLAAKFKNFVSRTVKCFKNIIDIGLRNKNILDKLGEMLVCLRHISITTEYFI